MQGFIHHSAHRRSIALGYLGVLAILIGLLQGCMPAGKERLGGYLTRVLPHELRFGKSPAVASLPPLPIIPDPQPAFDKLERSPETPELANFPGGLSQQAEPQPPPNLSGVSTNQQAKASSISIDSSLVNPQMLIRFFPTAAARPPEIEMLMNESIPFQPPAAVQRSSSAQYELK